MIIDSEEITVSNTIDFIKTFKLTEQFKKEYRLKKLDDWDWNEADEDVIHFFLDKMKGKFLVVYEEENNGYFRIFKLKDSDFEAFLKLKGLKKEFEKFENKRRIVEAI